MADDPKDTPPTDDPDVDSGDDREEDGKGASEIERMRASLRKANREAMLARKRAEELEAASATDHEKAAREKAEAARKEAEEKWRPRYVKAETRAALMAAGCSNPARLVKLVDMDSLEVDDDGEVSGLEAAIKALRKEWPEAFPSKAGGTRDVDAGNRGERDSGGPKSAAELLAKRLNAGR